MSCSVIENRENRRFIENKSLFLTETNMFLYSACRVQRTLSNDASFEGITRVFKQLSSIIPKMSFSVGALRENRHFWGNKSLFLTETDMFLRSACRVQRTLSNAARFEEITRVFKELSTIIPKISWSFGEMHENLHFSRLNHYSSPKQTCSCVLLVEFNEFYRIRRVLEE